MNRQLVALLIVAVVSMSGTRASESGAATAAASTTAEAQSTELEPPHALPLESAVAQAAAAVAAAPDAAAAAAPAAPAQLNNDLGEIWQEDDREVLIRNARRAKDNGGGGAGASGAGAADAAAGKKGRGVKKAQRLSAAKATVKPQSAVEMSDASGSKIPAHCRYSKSPWSDCDVKTNTRSRTLSLKRGSDCVQTRTIQKKCKKACRYEKGTWTECNSAGTMARSDRLKTASDPSCQATRDVTKNCNLAKADKKEKKERPAKNKGDKGQRKGGRA